MEDRSLIPQRKPMGNHGTRKEPGVPFVTEADWIPSFWNFLLKLDRYDLIAELVQNDLDQDATRTSITFEEGHLVCEGNGKPVESDGWQRLRNIHGAGERVPAKRGKIGVKNHGLKTAFTIGDEIRLLSAGQAIIQTLHARGRGKDPYPGASAEPEPDSQAPIDGCRIIVKYRDADIEPREGEAIVLGAVSAEDIDELFESACASTAEQFAGVVSPEVAPRYEIVLRHWRLGEARFVFSCTRPRKVAKGIEVFRRRCTVNGAASPPDGVQEEAARRFLPLKGRLKQRVPDFFRRGKLFFVEVSWPVNGRGQPRAGTGRFRYPIGYPLDSHEARTGYGVFFNAPIVSDTERHGPATNDATNKPLHAACEALLVDTLGQYVIPRWGAPGLNPLVPVSESEEQAVRPVLAHLARKGAMPTLRWRDAVELLLGGKHKKTSVGRAAIKKGAAEPRRYRFIVPIATWAEQVELSLSVICPVGEMQLDSRIHRDILRLLCDGHTDGFCRHFVTFDEKDAFDGIAAEGNEYFEAVGDPESELSDLLIARSYLDLIDSALAKNECDEDTEDALRATLSLPDAGLSARPFSELHMSALLPSDVPGLKVPPILHEGLAGHRLLRRRKWLRTRYTMATFLASGTLQEASEGTRKQFWKWLRRNERAIGPRERSALADVAVWPDATGNLGTLADLCDPSSSRIAGILAESIRRPHDHVKRSTLTVSGGRRRTSIRRLPSEEEIDDYIDRRMTRFAIGDILDADAITALNRFEADLARLLMDAGMRRVLSGVDVDDLPALAVDGSVQERSMLVEPSVAIGRLALRGQFLLKDTRHARPLNKLSPALAEPTAEMLLCTFDEDPGNVDALQARLQRFVALTEVGSSERGRLGGIPILPVGERLHAPKDLVFKGTHGDYWGDWKVQLSGKGLSQDDQGRYRAIGVTSASPNSGASLEFFRWLSGRDKIALQRHIPCVLRQILHQKGPEQWAEEHTDVPFVPVEGRDGIQLVSLRTARSRWILLPDERRIAEQVIKRDPKILLVIDRDEEVPRRITEQARRLGLRSLREALGEPEHVSGTGETVPAAKGCLEVVDKLKSGGFRRTFFKRMDDLGIESGLVRRDWHDRVSLITSVRCADAVKSGYRLRGKAYSIVVSSGFDPSSHTFWMKRERAVEVEVSSLCEAIAAQLVFNPSGRPVELLALERALRLEIRDPSYRRGTSGMSSSEEGRVTVDDAVQDEDCHESGDEGVEPGEAGPGHSPYEPDASRNVPNPGPIPSGGSVRVPHVSHRDGKRGANEGNESKRSALTLERVHVEDLKKNQYASHCQMCLCRRVPEELAPAGSYVEWEEVRRRVVEAHHVDLRSAGGARHAGNLILLCKFHHDNYGRRLTRIAVAAALHGEVEGKTIRFGGKRHGSDIQGQIMKVLVSDSDEVVELFFTNEHASCWRSSSPFLEG